MGKTFWKPANELRGFQKKETATFSRLFPYVWVVSFALVLGFAQVSAETIPLRTSLHNKFSIKLASNPTTGYRWRLGGKLIEKLLKPAGSQFIPPQTKLVGAGGREVWTFQAVGRGRTTIILEYARPWEKNIQPVDRRVYEVIIR